MATDTSLSTANLNDQVIIMVSDTGIGIPMGEQQKIFQQFYRVLAPGKSRPDGYGLGLYICSEIIAKHHGEIGVDSIEGSGSQFWFRLPVCRI